MNLLFKLALWSATLALNPLLQAQISSLNRPSPPTRVQALDVPNDSGYAIEIRWKDTSTSNVLFYEVFRSRLPEEIVSMDPGTPATSSENNIPPSTQNLWLSLATVDPGEESWTFSNAERGTRYSFKVVATTTNSSATSQIVTGESSAQWFDWEKSWILVIGGTICFFIILFIQLATRGHKLFVRKIAGLEAIDEAVGRATEMGRPVVFVPGIMDMDNVQTLAGLTLLGYVSRTIAEYDARLDVPVSRSLVMTTGREVVRQAYLEAGRPESYNEDMVHYLTDEQFGYVAGVNGMLLRDEPATCLYMGAFFAESLLLAETGNRIGAIQIAGTAMPSQLPFFVAACDYTLMGEELFAASAYLSGDPKQLGSLKGQDLGKLIVMAAILLGSLAATVALWTSNETLQSMVDFLKLEMFV